MITFEYENNLWAIRLQNGELVIESIAINRDPIIVHGNGIYCEDDGLLKAAQKFAFSNLT